MIKAGNACYVGVGIALGVVISAIVYGLFFHDVSLQQANTSDKKKPLYWVAPMDPNYKRDKPGKSPMGMDLIPVYEENSGEVDFDPGTVRIAPHVINNLGVRTATAQHQVFDADIQTVGYVQYNEDTLIHLHPRVDGWIEQLYVNNGDRVEQGEPLYTFYSPTLVNAQEEWLLALKHDNQRLLQAAQARLEALEVPTPAITALQQTQQVERAITFYAPQSGVVDQLTIREGFFVTPGTTLMAIGDLEEVWVEAEVFERQAPLVTAQAPITMVVDYLPGKVWYGHVDYIYPTLDEATRTVKVRMRVHNDNGLLKPNMFAQVTIDRDDDQEKVLLIPSEAVIRSGTQDRVVLALGDGRFKSVEVITGRFDDQFVEILEGLQPGDDVVISAQFLLDSESSKTSDFRRMDVNGVDDHQPQQPTMDRSTHQH